MAGTKTQTIRVDDQHLLSRTVDAAVASIERDGSEIVSVSHAAVSQGKTFGSRAGFYWSVLIAYRAGEA